MNKRWSPACLASPAALPVAPQRSPPLRARAGRGSEACPWSRWELRPELFPTGIPSSCPGPGPAPAPLFPAEMGSAKSVPVTPARPPPHNKHLARVADPRSPSAGIQRTPIQVRRGQRGGPCESPGLSERFPTPDPEALIFLHSQPAWGWTKSQGLGNPGWNLGRSQKSQAPNPIVLAGGEFSPA